MQFAEPNRQVSVERLQAISRQIRKDILEMLSEAGSGHPGGSLSAVELVVALYFAKMVHNPLDPRWADRDRFLLSKGHAAPLLYAVLAECGYFPKSELKTLRKLGSRLQGHPDPTKLPGVEIPGGPEGIGLSEGVGMALAARLDRKSYRVYVLMGDGELNEGEVWEAAMAAAKYKLDNLTAIVDRNGVQQDGLTEQIMPIEPVANKWRAFNWNVIEVDGYDFEQILGAIDEARSVRNKPTVIVAYTTKGKGVEFMEWQSEYHGKVPDKQTVQKAIEELQKR
ncbi:transketolase [Candidatus Marsarchaeota G2 archaeon OSP_D]|uniref:Transketolase n=5 Tax=Candidatus Marsarchaeota group 2 TaxID=2203771 RepID=A0A2R6CAJ0_9ARCH|nr:MAG: transketolase [Candidatus Marsarchaeota G2 archaeon OSP_D]PSN92729.1 MAG: transketolase [Candidatus Marsarchaeota G2 archaeon ECH_B_SAG-M15]PSN96003.1 MAG: transketolase [Candidatus Marsarchaeota G2 archaeon ECH_B_2]PSO02600.1 MAG: transketolase [Candidatus Marsarchaeota G2 archaeon ECH_B_1]PSO07858.1 MAG: transketolase [Candidatus Marsarchaeota G2 archaeon BE_D]